MVRWLGVFLLLPLSSVALDAVAETVEREKEPEINRLPAALNNIEANVTEFERNGLFQVSQARLGTAGSGHDDAIIWTLTTNRSLSWRHVEIFLDGMKDVRFYTRRRNKGRPVFSTILFYPAVIRADAINGESIPEGAAFDVWIYLSRNERLRIIGANADSMKFAPPMKRKL